MKVQEHQSLQLLMPANETTVTLGDRISITDNLNLFFGAPAQVKDHFPLQLSAKSMFVVLKGEMTFRVNLRDCVAGDGTCAIISPGTIVEQVDIAPDAQVIYLCYAFENVSPTSGVFHLSPSQVELLKNCYAMLRDILTDGAIAAVREDAACKCVELMESIVNGCDNRQETSEKKSRQDEIVARFLQCVQKNYREFRDLGFYAEQLELSLKYMSRVVFEQTGRHPSKWIKDYVILDAKAMLRSGQYSVQQVADALHFPNQSFFGKYFKEAVGVSPKKWR